MTSVTGQTADVKLSDDPTQAPIQAERQFLALWEAFAIGVHVPRALVRALGSADEALVLSQLLYWFLPNRDGELKTRVNRGGLRWVVKAHAEWSEETGLASRRCQKMLLRLRDRGIVTLEYHRFAGKRTTHARPDFAALADILGMSAEQIAVAPAPDSPESESPVIPNQDDRSSRNGTTDGHPKSGRPITETTLQKTTFLETTTESVCCNLDSDTELRKPPPGESPTHNRATKAAKSTSRNGNQSANGNVSTDECDQLERAVRKLCHLERIKLSDKQRRAVRAVAQELQRMGVDPDFVADGEELIRPANFADALLPHQVPEYVVKALDKLSDGEGRSFAVVDVIHDSERHQLRNNGGKLSLYYGMFSDPISEADAWRILDSSVRLGIVDSANAAAFRYAYRCQCELPGSDYDMEV